MTRAAYFAWLAYVGLVHMSATGSQAWVPEQSRHSRALVYSTQQENSSNNILMHRKDVSSAASESQYFAICVAAKDQHADINEWVVHHEKLGAGRIYVYDDNSDPPMRDELESHIQSGLVKYHFIEHDVHTRLEHPQIWVYTNCIQQYRALHQFMAFIDVDEFLILRDPSLPSLPAMLHEYEAYGGLVVNWVLFGSSGHVHRPKGGTLASYTKCLPPSHSMSLHVKTIANMKYVERVAGAPHFFYYNDGKTAVNERFEIVEGAVTRQNLVERVAIHHYVIKSKEDFEMKSARGSAMKNHKPKGWDDAIDRLATNDCGDATQ